jgi:hypothetical protein
MTPVEYGSIVIAIAVMAVRVILFFPRFNQTDDAVNA